MKYRILGIIAGLTLATGIVVSCSVTTTPTEQATPATQSTPAAKSADAMKSDKPAANSKSNKKSRSGNFISGEHQTDGRATIIQENGSYFIELDENFKTSTSGPDLFVILHRSPDILKISKPPDYGISQGDYISIAPLKNFGGKQRYAIPANIIPDQYQSVAVWCRQYNATFGFAPLVEN